MTPSSGRLATPSARRLAPLFLALLLVLTGVALDGPPASATVTYLCTGYTGCANAGYSNAGYSSAGSKMYWRMYAGHNCTNYAAYRMVKAGMSNTRPWSGSGNAENWGVAMKSITNSTPTVGAIAWWKGGVYPAGSAGHVAYVEQVVSSSEIVVSMDNWGGNFYWARITKATKGWPSGFIHFHDVRVTNTALPKVTGTPRVDAALTATPGSWSASGLTYHYQWLANGVAITDAIHSKMTLTSALQNKAISVRVTATKTGYPSATAVSAATSRVQASVLTATTPPKISGTPTVGSTLTATSGTWSPAATGIGYQWSANGTAIAGATTPTLVLDPSVLGKTITVTVTASRTGYTPVPSQSAATTAIGPGTMPTPATPALTGTDTVGRTLQLGALHPPAGATTQVQWVRDHSLVAGVSTTTYPLHSVDIGHQVGAIVTYSRPGYVPVAVHTALTDYVRTTPSLRLTLEPGHRRLVVHLTATATGVPTLNGVLQVRGPAGRLLRQVNVVKGAAGAVLDYLPTATRNYRFVMPATHSTVQVTVVRSVRIT